MEISERIKASEALVAYFSTPDCQVCKTLRPKVQALVETQKGIGFVYINTDEHPEVSGQYLVFSVPTIIIFMEGREIKRFSRFFSVEELAVLLERLGKT